MKRIKETELLIYIVSAELVGALSALVSGGNFSEYYLTLTKPPIAPPGWVFPIAWALLYALTAVGAYLISISYSDMSRAALRLYTVQLGVNFLWSPVFFRFNSFVGAVIIAAVLFILAAIMTVKFYRISETAALFTLPYLFWTGYAAYLSVGFLILNR